LQGGSEVKVYLDGFLKWTGTVYVSGRQLSYLFYKGKAHYPGTGSGLIHVNIGLSDHVKRPSSQLLRVGPTYLIEEILKYMLRLIFMHY
jgi:hypothetical protein